MCCSLLVAPTREFHHLCIARPIGAGQHWHSSENDERTHLVRINLHTNTDVSVNASHSIQSWSYLLLCYSSLWRVTHPFQLLAKQRKVRSLQILVRWSALILAPPIPVLAFSKMGVWRSSPTIKAIESLRRMWHSLRKVSGWSAMLRRTNWHRTQKVGRRWRVFPSIGASLCRYCLRRQTIDRSWISWSHCSTRHQTFSIQSDREEFQARHSNQHWQRREALHTRRDLGYGPGKDAWDSGRFFVVQYPSWSAETCLCRKRIWATTSPMRWSLFLPTSTMPNVKQRKMQQWSPV